jgi:hypothetical protein
MYFVSAKTAGYKAQGAERSGVYGQALQHWSRLFLPNPKGNAVFAARVVAALADMNNYPARTAPSGSAKTAIAKCTKYMSISPRAICVA